MDDRREQFFLMCEDICQTASLADIEVVLKTQDGRSSRGIPTLRRTGDPRRSDASDHGRGRIIAVGDDRFAIRMIEEISVTAPS